jgi:hypothetical protein
MICDVLCRTGQEWQPSKESWMSILLLADMWKFDGVRSQAIEMLGDLPLAPVEKLELCKRFDINMSWAEDAFTVLCERVEPLSDEEASRVGLETSNRIARGREERIQQELFTSHGREKTIGKELAIARGRVERAQKELQRMKEKSKPKVHVVHSRKQSIVHRLMGRKEPEPTVQCANQ